MRAGHAFGAIEQKGLTNHATERAELERLRVISEGALGRDAPGIRLRLRLGVVAEGALGRGARGIRARLLLVLPGRRVLRTRSFHKGTDRRHLKTSALRSYLNDSKHEPGSLPAAVLLLLILLLLLLSLCEVPLHPARSSREYEWQKAQ